MAHFVASLRPVHLDRIVVRRRRVPLLGVMLNFVDVSFAIRILDELLVGFDPG